MANSTEEINSAPPAAPADGATRQIPIVCPGHSRPLAEVAYGTSPDGLFLISACHDKLPMLRRGDNGDWIGTFEGHKGATWSAKLNHNSTRAVTGSADFSVKLWNSVNGDVLHTFPHKHVVKSVEFGPESSNTLWTGGHDKILRCFDLSNFEAPPMELACKDAIRKIVVIDENRVITGETSGLIQLWDVRESKEKSVKEVNVGADVMDMELSRNGSILTVAAGNLVKLFDVTKNLEEISSFEMPINFREEGGASLHPTLDRFIAGGSDTWVRVFDSKTGELLETHKGHHGPVRCLRFSPDGDSFATGSEDGTIRIWQTDLKSSAATTVSHKSEEPADSK